MNHRPVRTPAAWHWSVQHLHSPAPGHRIDQIKQLRQAEYQAAAVALDRRRLGTSYRRDGAYGADADR
jgi:hypothetical protein